MHIIHTWRTAVQMLKYCKHRAWLVYGSTGGMDMGQELEKVRQARESFDRILHYKVYRDVIRDDMQLSLLLELVQGGSYKRILDIGTGTGYLAFPLAEAYPDAQVYGIDIAESIIRENERHVEESNMSNIFFQAFDGIHYPFEEESFDLVVSRYAFHHFPNPGNAVEQIQRILLPGGKVLISDPVRDMKDYRGVIDVFMRIKGDGHIQFYTEEELEELFVKQGLQKEKQVFTNMTFPFAPGAAYTELYQKLTDEDRSLYGIIEENGIIRVGHIAVGNTVFKKI